VTTDEAGRTLDEQLQQFVGLEVGPPAPAPDAVNVPMIRHWCEAIGDDNPVYLDADAAAASVHGGLVAPPTMLQAWVMNGLRGPTRTADGPYQQMNELLFSHGFTSVVATNCEQTYVRYLRPGDQLTMRTVIDSISPQKTTALGTGHFVTTRQDYFDADGELVGSMLFRIIRFRPRAAPAARPAAARPRPATTHDNQWWFDAVGDGRLVIQRCADCGRLRHPTGPMCPACHSRHWDCVDAADRGTIHSWVVTHHPQVPGFEYPLPIVLVDVAPASGGTERVRMVMNADTVDGLAIDRTVRIEIRAVDDELRLPFAVLDGAEDAEGHA
jgi:uncharacterized OB-fold protein/acyl dehydratase